MHRTMSTWEMEVEDVLAQISLHIETSANRYEES
jgi:hypothetical protein